MKLYARSDWQEMLGALAVVLTVTVVMVAIYTATLP
jgi:hypothetical protein